MTHSAVPPGSHRPVVALLGCLLAAAAHAAGPRAEAVLPETTVGYASIADLPDFLDRWNKTQIGQLFDLPEMEPFLTRLRDRATQRDGRIEDRLGVTFEELGDATSGEVAFALIPARGDSETAAVVVLADIAEKRAEAEAVVEKIRARLESREATALSPPGAEVTVYSIPFKDGPRRTVAYFMAAERFVACNDADVAASLLDALKRPPGAALKSNDVYVATLAMADGGTPAIRPTVTWWMDPFAYDEAARTLDGPETKRADSEKKDPVAILRGEGFDAVRGVGGRVVLAVDGERDVLHTTAAYAPPKPGAAGKPASERYDGALGALDTPNSRDHDVADWAPRDVAGYKSLNVDIQNLFDNVGSLVDAFVYKNAFENTLEAFEKDPYGPKIDLRDEVVAHLGSRVVSMTDYTEPTTVDCERYLTVVDVTDEDALRGPLDKWMKSDGAERKEITTPDGEAIYYWEIVPEDDPADLAELDDGLLPIDGDDDLFGEDEPEDRVLRRAAVCLHDGTLAVGSDVDFLHHAFFGVDADAALATDPELQRTLRALDGVAPPQRAAWSFTRNAESFRATYDLVRTNQMPQSQTFFGRLLNRFLTTPEEREAHLVREQKIDGSTLPEFEVARPYLGPSARAVRSGDDGWVVVGVVLRSDAD